MQTRFKYLIDHVISTIHEDEKEDMKAYHSFYFKHAEELNQWAIKELEDHPAFGPIVRSMTPEMHRQNQEVSLRLQKGAIFDSDWENYVVHNVQQGITYAKMGLDFYKWYDLLPLVRNFLMPKLINEHNDDQAFMISIMRGMDRFFNIAMCIIAEAYLNESKQIILEQKQEQERLNEDLKKMLASLEEKNNELEQFAYIASHDLQEPLRTSTSYVGLLQDSCGNALPEDGKIFLEQIVSASERMRMLIQGLLDYSRLGKDKQKEHINCNKLIAEVVANMEASLNETGATINVGKLPELEGYPVEIQQLFQNLISNAVKFRKKDIPPQIDINAEELNNHWKFSVKDNGIGIPKEFNKKIFVIFQRLHSKKEFEGSGIGLAHCKKIVDLHSGKIWVESTPGEGSAFYFTISKT